MTSSPQFSRRSVTRAAAWSVPVVAVASAAPARAASGTAGVIISGACVAGLPLGDVTVGAAQFTLSAVEVDLQPGSTFLLSGEHLEEVSVDQAGRVDVTGPVDGVKTVTLASPIEAGSSLVLRASGMYAQATDPDLTLTAGSLNGGDLASAATATVDLQPYQMSFGDFSQWFGVCDQAAARAIDQELARMSDRQKSQVVTRIRRARTRR